jgi:hypothetical protein
VVERQQRGAGGGDAQPGKNDESRNARWISVSSIVDAMNGTSDGTLQRVAQLVSPESMSIVHIVPSDGRFFSSTGMPGCCISGFFGLSLSEPSLTPHGDAWQ